MKLRIFALLIVNVTACKETIVTAPFMNSKFFLQRYAEADEEARGSSADVIAHVQVNQA